MLESGTVFGYWHGGAGVFSDKINAAMQRADQGTKTDLCRIMDARRSDKARNHNYTQVYFELLDPIRDKITKFVEVGVGTKNADVPSAMLGPTYITGASLRGWRDFLPNASIFGADVDKRILFTEPRIQTRFIDQLDVLTIQSFWEEVGGNCDIILDDGLHTYEANSNLVRNSLDKVAVGGYYIIEDIVEFDQNLKKFPLLLSELGMPAAYFRLPHREGMIDNCLALIQRI
jgi:hypothetical protein